MGPSCAPPRPSCTPPLPLFNFISHKRGGTVPPNKNSAGTSHLVPPAQTPPPTCSNTPSCNVVGRSHLVPPAQNPSVFLWWGNPTSSYLIRTTSFLWRGDSTSPHLQETLQFSCGRTIPPRPTCSKTFSFMWWDDPTSPHLLKTL